MTPGSERDQGTLVFRDQRDGAGVSWRWVSLLDDGGLEVSGQDLGVDVQRFWGSGEYEFSRRLTSADVTRLCELLGGVARRELLAKIEDTFADTGALERFLELNEIPGKFWSRVGD